MRTNLLLGNGINLDLGISELCAEKIFYRFQDILIKTSSMYEYLFGKGFDMKICNSIFADCINNPEKLGIESLARSVYDYLKKPEKWTENSKSDLKRFITVSAINAIFYNGEKTIDITPIRNNTNKVAILKSYSNIYSLNYAEFWDEADKCSFLHGKYTLSELLSNKKEIILFYPYKDELGTYQKHIKQLADKFFMCRYFPQVVFTPLMDKQDSLYEGHVPCESLFPSPNLLPLEVPRLYIELDGIDSLDIFGMSPFGDDRLIQKLSAIPDLRIYVYNMDKKEVDKWNDLLNRECCVDSSLFYIN